MPAPPSASWCCYRSYPSARCSAVLEILRVEASADNGTSVLTSTARWFYATGRKEVPDLGPPMRQPAFQLAHVAQHRDRSMLSEQSSTRAAGANALRQDADEGNLRGPGRQRVVHNVAQIQ